MSKLLSDLNELVAGRLSGAQTTTANPYNTTLDEQVMEGMERVAALETDGPVGWTVYAMETGETKGARRYSIIAENSGVAVIDVINRYNLVWDEITFEVFRQGSGDEFRYERRLRQI